MERRLSSCSSTRPRRSAQEHCGKADIVGAVTRLAPALCAIGATAILAAQPPARSGQVFRSGVDVTTIDVTVVARNGDPIRDLKAEDFTVNVDGKPRAIVSAQFVGFDEPSAESKAAAPAS